MRSSVLTRNRSILIIASLISLFFNSFYVLSISAQQVVRPGEKPAEIDLSANLVLPERRVMAIVMTEMKNPANQGQWFSWNHGGRKPDTLVAAGHRDVASIFYPAIGPYDFADPQYQEYLLQSLRMCDIDVISCHVWQTPQADPTRWNTLSGFIPRVKQWGMHAFARTGDLRLKSDQFDEWLKAQRAWHELFEPVSLQIDGRPVHSFFGLSAFKPADVQRFQDSFAPEHRPFLLMKCHSRVEDVARWHGVVEGMYDWTTYASYRKTLKREGVNDWMPYDVMMTNSRLDLERATAVLRRGLMRLYISSVAPGFDDSPVNGWNRGTHIIEREEGRTYQFLWDQVHAHQGSMVSIATWNDYPEASMIEPTAEFGVKYVELTRSNVARFKGTQADDTPLELPIWIFRVRKSGVANDVLAAMDEASELIRQRRFREAYDLVKPHAEQQGVIDVKYWNRY